MKILNMVSKNFTCPPIILKIFRPEISMVVEISTDFDLLSIIEFQIYSFILPILQANLGKILAKMLSNCVICIKSHSTSKYCITNYDIGYVYIVTLFRYYNVKNSRTYDSGLQ